MEFLKTYSEEKICKSYVQINFFLQQMEELDNHYSRVAKISLKQKDCSYKRSSITCTKRAKFY